MMIQSETYYQRLGIPYNADSDLIRRAYRSLARHYHPDHNSDDPEAEDRFKAINEAYQVLSDPEKRVLYDRYGDEWHYYATATISAVNDGAFPFHWDERNRSTDSVSLPPNSNGDAPSRGDPTQPRLRMRHMHVSVRITLEEAFHGAIRTYHEDSAQVEVTIPPGVETGTRLCVPGAGGPGDENTPPGDLFMDMVVLPHEHFVRSDNDLRSSLQVHPELRGRGGSIVVPTLAQPVYLTIPPNTANGAVFRLKGLGMPHLYLPEQCGDLYVKVVD
jgi:DnaJ-class molecular chaperone